MLSETCVQFGVSSLQLAPQVHLMWVDESLSLLIAVARVVPDLKLPQELAVMCL